MIEQYKVLLGLFAIILICSGKLLKDYFYHNHLIEGMSSQPVVTNPSVLYRPPISAASDQTGSSITFRFTTATLIPNTGNLLLSCLNTQLTAAGVVLPTTPASYVATVTSTTNVADKPITSFTALPVVDNTSNTITFTPIFGTNSVQAALQQISSGTTIQIVVSGVTIRKATASTDNISKTIIFTIRGVTTDSTTVNLTIEPPKVIGIAGSSSTTSDIESALTGLDAAIAADPTNQSLINAKNALVQILTDTYGTVAGAGAVFTSGSLYEAQKTALDFISKEKSRTDKNVKILETDNSNKKRMSQINMYYTQNYQANTEIMKYIIYICFTLIVLTLLKSKDYIPSSIATLGTIFILTLGSIVIGKKIFDILRRNDMEFDKYDWTFDQDKIDNSKLVQTNANPTDLSMLASMNAPAPCYGPACCDAGTSWYAKGKKCMTTAAAATAEAADAAAAAAPA
jgi:hypothetical protein